VDKSVVLLHHNIEHAWIVYTCNIYFDML